MSEQVRLQKFLAQCGICSRRKAEEYILNGMVTVDGVLISEMGVNVTPGVSKVTFRGQPVTTAETPVYYLLNKPKGYVTTLKDPQGRPIVTSLITESTARLFPVGRLDLDTQGALILTNDGALAQKIQHPSHTTDKTYEALVRGTPSNSALQQLERGIPLEGKMTSPAKITRLSSKGPNTLMQIVIHEGRKHQVKKMFAYIKHPVVELKRTAYGKLQLGKLAIGKYRLLSISDINRIFL
ncbi:MAG: 23S rRNA pseudouridine2605 synthase [Desulforhopalus sp.]|jgi:23S rRNA pseudouridine2605 synthase